MSLEASDRRWPTFCQPPAGLTWPLRITNALVLQQLIHHHSPPAARTFACGLHAGTQYMLHSSSLQSWSPLNAFGPSRGLWQAAASPWECTRQQHWTWNALAVGDSLTHTLLSQCARDFVCAAFCCRLCPAFDGNLQGKVKSSCPAVPAWKNVSVQDFNPTSQLPCSNHELAACYSCCDHACLQPSQ